MNIFSQLITKPWLAVDGNIDDLQSHFAISVSHSKLGLRIFLVVVSVLFSLLIIAYAERIVSVEWRPAPQPALLWFSTTLLVLASAGMQGALISIRHQRSDLMKICIMFGGILALAFLFAQLLAWQQLNSLPSFNVSNPAIAFFYLITALHGLHLLGGIVAWYRTSVKLWRGTSMNDVRESIELCTTYWHFLLVVWLILFGLLFSGNDHLAILLTICGLK